MTLKAMAVAAVMAVTAVPVAVLAADDTASKRSDAGQFVNDSAITAKVKAALIAEKDLKAMDINVDTRDGVVQLSGFAVSSAQIVRAADVAGKVKGVKQVQNDIQLKAETGG